MSRYIRKTAIMAKIETTAGVDAAPTGASDALLVSDISITPLEAQNVDRSLVRPFFGASEQLVATAYVKCSFTVELAGSGVAGTAPAWAPLLQACAAAEAALTSPARNELTPATDGLKTVTIYWYDDGVLHKLVGAMGTVKLSAKAGGRGTLAFEFSGVDGGVTAAAADALDLARWKKPPTLAMANVVDITVGASYSAGALSGGAVYPSTGLEMDLANEVVFTPLLSNESIDITNRQTTGHMDIDLTPAQEVAFMASVKANALQSVALTVGKNAGNTILIYGPSVQLINPTKQEINGRRLIGFDMRFVPNLGNDEWRIVAL